MSNISLEAAVRTCKVNSGWANRIQSDRFENSNLLMCPVWNERDLTGRKVCEDSFYTKREGCNSPLDRINVENDQRPQYAEYITLDTSGYRADMYGGVEQPKQSVSEGFVPHVEQGFAPYVEHYVQGMEKTMNEQDATLGCQTLNNVHKYTGQFGQGNFRDSIEPRCNIYPYEYAMASASQQQRYAQGLAQASKSESYRNFS